MPHLHHPIAYHGPRARARIVGLHGAVAVGLAGLALAAPSALARPDYTGTAPRAESAAGPYIDLRSPDAKDAAAATPQTSSLAGTTDATRTPTPAPATSKADDGFDWGSAGIGAGASFALILLASGGVAVTQRSRTRLAH
jgi:hypothetical protein